MSCSFCYNRGHNITMCNDIKIDIYYHRIKNIFMYILRQIYPHNIENYTELGKSILNRFKLRELRAIGVQFCWQNARMNKSQLIPIIWDYFKTRIYYPPPLPEEQQPPELIIDRTPSPLLMRYGNMTISHMMQYYRNDEHIVNIEMDLMNNMIIRNLIDAEAFIAAVEAQVQAQAEARQAHVEARQAQIDAHLEAQIQAQLAQQLEAQQLEAQQLEAQNKRYNIMPTIIIKDKNTEVEEDADCPICYESIKSVDLITLNCSHKFCGSCITHILENHNSNSNSNPTCALCRTYMCKFDIQNPVVYHLVAKYCVAL